MRGFARAVVGLLEAGIDFARRLSQLTPRRHVHDGAFLDRPVDRAGHHDHHAAFFGSDASLEHQSERLDDATGGFDFAAEIRPAC
jgi:hypothetical protein